jgi:AcrR family transcriptional regulator
MIEREAGPLSGRQAIDSTCACRYKVQKYHNLFNMFRKPDKSRSMPDDDKRQQQLLEAAAAVILRQGYNKTTMGDIAEAAGASRGTVYLYFKGKDELFEALLYREYMHYSQTWLETLEADPNGGTIGGCYRALFQTVNRRPLLAALLRRDARVIGNYLRKPDNLFAQMQVGVNSAEFIRALQAAGDIRQDIEADVIIHILEMLSYGQLTIGDFKAPDQFPPEAAVMSALADMMDRALRRDDGGNSEAGKAIFRQMTLAARAQLEQLKQASDTQRATRQGAVHDHR